MVLKILGLIAIVSCTEQWDSPTRGPAVTREETTEEMRHAGTALAWWMTPNGHGVWTVTYHAAWRPRVENVMLASANMMFQLTIYGDTPRAGQRTALPSIQDVFLGVQTAVEVWRDVELFARSWSIDLLVAFDPAVWGSLQPELWLAEFLAHCHRCQVDALALRDSSCDVDSLRDHVDLYRPLGKPLWLMEMDCSEFNIPYVKEASEILEEERLVQKSAWRNSMWRSEGSEPRGEDFVSTAEVVSGAGQVLASVPSPCEPREVGAQTRLLQNAVDDILGDMKAVHYVPRMVGLTFEDPLNAFLSRIYHRDLQTIREELGGNTIVLAEPSENLPLGGSWERFLDECVSQNIAVFASFSLKFFIDLGLSSSEMSSAIEKSFDNFLRYFMMGDSERIWGDAYCTAKGLLHPAVKGWIITGLPTLEALVSSAYFTLGGVSSEIDVSLLTRTTVRVAMRSVSQCVQMMYGEDSLVGLAVSLDTPTAKANTTLFDTSLSNVLDSFELDDFEGEYFDFWVLEAKLPPVRSAVAQVLAALETLNGHIQRKPIIPQLGVSCAIPREGVLDMNISLQQELLVQIFDSVKTLFLRSLILFQFSDDWSATEGLNDTSCPAGHGGVMMQSTCGSISGLVRDTTVVAVEYMGLSAHTTWLLHACIEPRWLDVDSGPHVVGVLSQEVIRREGAFSFEPGKGDGSLRMCVMSSYLDTVLPTIIGNASVPHSMVLLALLSILATCCAWPFNRSTSDKACPAAESAPPGIMPFDNGIGDAKYMFQHKRTKKKKKARRTASPKAASPEPPSPRTPTFLGVASCSTLSLSDVALSLIFNVTAFPSDPLRQLEGQADVIVYCSKLCDEQHAHLVLRSALAAQQRILEYHVLSEERCQPPSRDNVFYKAVQAVHKRALEGYFLWSRKPVLPAKTREHITTMFIDTLLMYVLQAISEQLLHTPELLNAVYHIMREKRRLHYGALCQILDVYTNSSDPYGGLMLDDINDAISRSLAPNVSVRALEDSLGEVTRKSLIRRHMYPQRGLTAMIKLLGDFRSSVELKAIVAYLAYGAYTGDLKYRLEAFVSDTAAMHAVGHAISEILAIFNFFYIRMDWGRAEQFVRILLGLLISTFVATVGKKLGSDWVGRGYLGGRLVWLLFLRNNGKPWMPFLRAPHLFPTNPKSKRRSTLMRKMTFKHRLCYWLCVLGFCFVFEYYFVFSVLEGITVDSLCASRCDRAIWGSKCVACLSGAGALYVMISSLLCVDMLMGNVLFTCLWGMKLGMSQGISGMRKSADSAVFLSDSTRGLGKDTARHGCLMQHIFGEHWRSIWNLLCYRLWKEDLLNTLETDELMQMATKGNSEKNRDVPLHLSDLHTIVRERLSFFFASLRFICEGERTRHASGLISEDAVVVGGEKQRERKFVHHGIYRMSDVIPLSQIIPAVDEEVILSELFLKGDRGRNLKWIIGKYKREWMHLTLRLSETNLVNRFVDESVSPSVSPQARQEIRVWASMRSQTVLRTVQGAVNYHIALESNPAVFSPHSDISKRSQLERFVELIWAHQTHGDNNARDRDVRWTLMEYADYPIFLVFDLDMLHLTSEDRRVMGQMVRLRLKQDVGYQTDTEIEAFFDQFPYISCKAMYCRRESFEERDRYFQMLSLKGVVHENFRRTQVDAWDPMSVLNLNIVEATPRRGALMIGKNKQNRTQGKAGNQVNALRLSRGFVVQAMDANMGSFIGEAFKVSTVLKYFWQSEDTSRTRMIGFREHIFTGSHGVCGDINAVAEWSFGTIIQRMQAALGVRMHYGHPDFVDLFWARSRGGMSKASPHINLSEDIFAGLNVKNRGERSDYVDVLEMEKGREVSFNAASVFLNKISAGNVGVWRSKDLTEATSLLSTVDQLSFYFATVGYFVSLTIIDCTVYLFLFMHIVLSLASVSLHELGALGSTVSSEWIWGPAVFMYLPPLLEGSLEYGSVAESLKRVVSGFDPMAEMFPAGILYWFLTLVFFTFQNKTKAAAVRHALTAGTANYKATGRPNANTRLTLLDSFLQYRNLHYRDGVLFLLYYVLYKLANLGLAGSLPMMTIVFSAVCWLVVPTLFAPYPSWLNLTEDVSAFYDFMMRCPSDSSRTELQHRRNWLSVSYSGKRLAVDIAKKGSTGVPGNLFELLVKDAQEKHEKLRYTWDQDLILLVMSIVRLVLLLMVLPATIAEALEFCALVWVLHCFLVLTFGIFLELLCLLMLFILYILSFSVATDSANVLLALGLLLQLLDTLSHVLMFVVRRLPFIRNDVGYSNVHVGMKVIPGTDWMYDMKKEDGPQNAAQGSSMVGTVINDEAKADGFCVVRWLSGVEGRYRISTPSTSTTDLKVHPNSSAVAVEASVLLCGKYHMSLFVALVVCIAHFLVSCLLILVDMPCFGSLHSRMLRLPSARELETASYCEGGGGHAAMPTMAMSARDEKASIEDLPRGPWEKVLRRPPLQPVPPAYVLDEPSYRGSQWREMCRMRLTRRALGMLNTSMSMNTNQRVSAEDLGRAFQVLPVSVEHDGLRCPLDAALMVNSYLLFTFKATSGPIFDVIEELLETKCHGSADLEATESVERVWVPIYSFEVPTVFSLGLQQAVVDMQRAVADGTAEARQLRFCLRATDLENFGRRHVDQDGPMVDESHCGLSMQEQPNDLLLLSQGSWKEFTLLWAQHRLRGCRSTGSKLVYCMTPPDTSFDLQGTATVPWHVLTVIMGFFVCRAPATPWDDADGVVQLGSGAGDLEGLARFSSASRAAYRASRGHHLWPFGHGICVVGVDPDPVQTGLRPQPPALLFAFQNEKPDDEFLKRFFGVASASNLDAAISTKWLPVFNFLVPDSWIGKSVMEVARKGEIIVWGIRRSDTRGTRAIWFPGPGLKDERGEETYVEKFGASDEVVLPFWSARAFVKKYVRCSPHPVVLHRKQTI